MNSAVGDENEYEYEYDDNETEVRQSPITEVTGFFCIVLIVLQTFLVDLDLFSLNSAVISKAPARRRSRKPRRRRKAALEAESPSQDPFNVDSLNDGEAATDTRQLDQAVPGIDSNQNKGGGVQILDLHCHNPMISFQDQMYSCTWTDMIGTNMFFTHPLELPLFDAYKSTDHYDLLGISRIKLAGRRAQVTEKKVTKKRARDAQDEAELADTGENQGIRTDTGKSLGDFVSRNTSGNMELRKQADFLQRLSAAKKARGDKDIVRTFVSKHTTMGPSSGNAEKKAMLRDEVDELNQRILRGDAQALARLNEIDAELEEGVDDTGPTQTQAQPGDLLMLDDGPANH